MKYAVRITLLFLVALVLAPAQARAFLDGQNCAVQINDKCYNAPPGANISVSNGRVIINGQEVTNLQDWKVPSVTIQVHGDAGSISTTAGDINVTGNATTIDTTSGNVQIGGSVQSAQTVSGDVRAQHINGPVSTVSGDCRPF